MVRGDRFEEKPHYKYKVDSFKDENGVEVSRQRPRIEVVFRNHAERYDPKTNPEFRTYGLVDSGADVCFIPRTIAEILKLELKEESKKESIGAGGKFTTYKTEMYLEIVYKGKRIGIDTVDVMVSEKDPVGIELEKNILIGRKGLFDKYEITFNEPQKVMNFKKIHSDRHVKK